MAAALTPEGLAARLKIRKTWVYEQTRSHNQNPFPHLRVGRYLQFDRTKVVEWLTQEKENSKRSRRR